MMISLNRILYKIKNSNIIFCFSLNPFNWSLKPKFVKVPSYADDWLVDPYLKEYRAQFLFLKIILLIELADYDILLKDLNDIMPH